MYKRYWNLNKRPFEAAAEPEFYYPNESHQGALLKLRYAIENRQGAALLTGDSGLGKTQLVRTLQEHIAVSPLVHVVYPKMGSNELLAYIARDLTASENNLDGPADESIRRIHQGLQANAEQGRHAVLVIDEAHIMDPHEGLEAIRLLLNLQIHTQPAFSVLLVGQTGVLSKLARTAALDELIAIKCLIRPLGLEETIGYVRHRLQAAGARGEIFEHEALETLHQLSSGVPRQINRICDLALLVGFAEQHPTISSLQLEAISRELVKIAA
ncbi:MAG: AAA family ATPase [Planctomycetales bacterium]